MHGWTPAPWTQTEGGSCNLPRGLGVLARMSRVRTHEDVEVTEAKGGGRLAELYATPKNVLEKASLAISK